MAQGVIELPHALRPWSEQLAWLHDDVVGSIGEWLPLLRTLVGPLAIPRSAFAGEPDGFAGLTRRGTYDRLVASEWLLAEELPDEFIRRAVMGEHLFNEVARIEPTGSRTSIALFDAGPDQLGAPRLVHIAMLIVLTVRAAA